MWPFAMLSLYVYHLLRTYPVHEPTNLRQIYLIGAQRDVGPESLSGQIHHRNKRKSRTNVFRRVMSHHVSADQIPERASDKNVRRKMLACGHAARANCQGKSVSRYLDRLAWIFRCNYARQREAFRCVSRRKRTVKLVGTSAMRPESPLAVSFVGTFAVRSKLQSFYYQQGIDDRFRSQTPCFGKVFVVNPQPKEVEPRGTS